MNLNKKVATRVAFIIVLLWFFLSVGLIVWQWQFSLKEFKEVSTDTTIEEYSQ